MNDRQLRSFIMACEKGSLTKAAEASFISTPAFVQQINLLEETVGFKLFERSSHGIQLTEAGKDFYESAKTIVRTYDHAVEKGRAFEKTHGDILRIGADPIEAAPYLADICELLRQRDPDIRIAFVEAPYARQFQMLTEEECDACYLFHSRKNEEMGLIFTPLYEDTFSVCVSPKDPLAMHDAVRAEDLEGRLLFLEEIYHDEIQVYAILRYIEEHGIHASFDSRIYSSSTPADVMLAGGILLTPSRYIGDCAPPLAAVPFQWPASEYGIVHRRETSLALDELIAASAEYFDLP